MCVLRPRSIRFVILKTRCRISRELIVSEQYYTTNNFCRTPLPFASPPTIKGARERGLRGISSPTTGGFFDGVQGLHLRHRRNRLGLR